MAEKELNTKMGEDKETTSNDFDSNSEDDLDIICNMIFMLPLEYDIISKVTEDEDGSLKKWLLRSLYVTMS